MGYKKTVIILTAGLALMTAGCGKKEKMAEITPTPVPTVAATPTPVPATPTPMPTATPAPRMIGTKTTDSKFIYLTNNTEGRIRGLYIKTSDSGDWGKNLITGESSVKAAEQVRMYYQPKSGEAVTYDMRFLDGNGNAYEIYNVELGDMERASLKKDSEQGIYYLSYMSLSSRNEKDTKGNYTSSYDTDNDDDSSDAPIQYYDNYGTDDSGSDDSSDDSNYYYDNDVLEGDDSDDSSGSDDSGSGDGSDDSDSDDSSDGSEDSNSGDVIVWDDNGQWSQE